MSIDIQFLVAGGDSQTVEFKERVPPPDIIARLISAFANTDGGTIIFGIRERHARPEWVFTLPQNMHHFVGVSPEQFERAYQHALELVTGAVNIEKSIVNFGGKPIGVIQVEKSSSPVSSSDGYFARLGESTRALSAQELSEKAKHASNPNQAIESLAQTVEKQTDEIAKLRVAFESANSWKRKALYALIGALATGVAKAFFAAIGVEIG